ncbi:MAG: hypothetical protein ACSHYF_10230 [Verrucomicrobiaceae bacterium]
MIRYRLFARYLCSLIAASGIASAQKEGGSSGTDGVVGSGTVSDAARVDDRSRSAAYQNYVSSLRSKVNSERSATSFDSNVKEGDIVDNVAETVRTETVSQSFTDVEVAELVAASVDMANTISGESDGTGDDRGDGRTGDVGNTSPWWPQSTNFACDGTSGTVSPGGQTLIGTHGTDGDLEVPNHTWYIDVTPSSGVDLVYAAGAMAINDSILNLNVMGTLTADSYTFVTVYPGYGRGRFCVVNGMPSGYELVYGESSISLAKSSSLAVPELGTVLPLMAMMGPWFIGRRRQT